jgi:hypothetical protein
VVAQLALRHLGDEAFHVGEVVVHAAGRDARVLGDLLCRGSKLAAAVESEQGVDDGLTVPGAPQDASVDRYPRHVTIQQ